MKKSRISDKNKSMRGILLLSLLIFVLATGLTADEKKDDAAMISSFKKANKFYKKGLTSFSKNKVDKATDNFIKCLDQFSNHAGAYYYLAKIAYQQGRLGEANTNILKAKENYPTFVKMNKAIFMRTNKKYKETRSEIGKQAGGRGSFASGRANRQAREESGKHFERAADGFQRYMASVKIIQADYHFLHGNIYYKVKKFNEAVAEFAETIKLNPRHDLVYTNLASIYFMAKDYQKAKELVKQAEANGVAVNPKLKEAIESH